MKLSHQYHSQIHHIY